MRQGTVMVSGHELELYYDTLNRPMVTRKASAEMTITGWFVWKNHNLNHGWK